MLGANRCCLEQSRLCRMCRNANTSEVDLTSGEKFPWKQLFKGIPLDKAQKVIGEGITKFTFRLLSEKHCFEITCRDGTKWRVMERYALPRKIGDDGQPYNWGEFTQLYEGSALSKWEKSADEEDPENVCFTCTGQHELLHINTFKPLQNNSKKKKQTNR